MERKFFFIIFSAVFLLIALVFYLGFFNGEKMPTVVFALSETVPSGSGVQSIVSDNINIELIKLISAIELDFDSLKSSQIESLVVNGDIPIKPQLEGRENPFVPY